MKDINKAAKLAWVQLPDRFDNRHEVWHTGVMNMFEALFDLHAEYPA